MTPTRSTIHSIASNALQESSSIATPEVPSLERLNEVRSRCLAFAERHISDSETLLDAEGYESAYILASLGLEEIGKAEMQILRANLGTPFDEEFQVSVDEGETDHKHKLMWAVFTGISGKRPPTTQEFRQAREYAETIYLRRLELAYSPTIGDGQREEVEPAHTKSLVKLARARLELAKLRSIGARDEEQQAKLQWITNLLQDNTFRRFMAARTADPKFQEAQESEWLDELKVEWEEWLRKNSDTLAAELERHPTADSQDARRWQLKLGFDSGWHRLRPRILQPWSGPHSPFTFERDREDDRRLVVQLNLPGSIPLGAVWLVGHDLARLLLLALNIGSMGLFWWRVSKHKNSFCDGIRALDGEGTFVIDRKDPGALEWGGERTLSGEDLRRVMICYALLTRQQKPGSPFLLYEYELGVGAWAMHDIHVYLAPTAFDYFLRAYRTVLRHFRGWSGGSIIPELDTHLGKLLDAEELAELKMHVKEAEERNLVPANIGIKFATMLKIASDMVLNLAAKDHWTQSSSPLRNSE